MKKQTDIAKKAISVIKQGTHLIKKGDKTTNEDDKTAPLKNTISLIYDSSHGFLHANFSIDKLFF